MSNKIKAFTLIELLVVVAIIGILAAVGVVAYSGYTSGAKKSAAKANHKTVIKYIMNEIARCEIEDTVMNGNLTCSGRSHQSVIDAIVKSFGKGSQSHFKNPYGKGSQDANDTAVTDGGTYSNDYGIGYIRLMIEADYVIKIGTCYAIPCYENKSNYNYYEDILRVLDTPK
tara:strand:+ start:196 stop:708 length:513 start_codon:yes stop_codon:yes gene_type:complete